MSFAISLSRYNLSVVSVIITFNIITQMIMRPPLVYDNYNIKSINNSMGYRRWMHATDFRRVCPDNNKRRFVPVALDELRKLYNYRGSKWTCDVRTCYATRHVALGQTASQRPHFQPTRRVRYLSFYHMLIS